MLLQKAKPESKDAEGNVIPATSDIHRFFSRVAGITHVFAGKQGDDGTHKGGGTIAVFLGGKYDTDHPQEIYELQEYCKLKDRSDILDHDPQAIPVPVAQQTPAAEQAAVKNADQIAAALALKANLQGAAGQTVLAKAPTGGAVQSNSK
jgi:hypothetical protein